ncbi:protein-export chaperone SecB [Acinetobacter baumannii]
MVSTLTTQGGYPPVLLRPIDFSELYARNLARAQEMQAQGTA